MQVTALPILFTVLFEATTAQRCCPPPLPPLPPIMSILNSILPECGLQNQCYDSLPLSDCDCLKPRCYDDILPPLIDCGCARPMYYDRPMCSDGPMCSYRSMCSDRPMCYDKPMCYDRPMCDSMLDYEFIRPGCCEKLLPSPMLDFGCVKPMCYDGPMLAPIDCGCMRGYDLVPPPMSDCGYAMPMCYDTPMCYDAPMLDCGCGKSKCCKPLMDCGCLRSTCNGQLVLPPMRVELPRDLGYLPSAVPVVSSYFRPAVEVGSCAGASVPVTSPCGCLALAAPVCPDIAPLVRSVIL